MRKIVLLIAAAALIIGTAGLWAGPQGTSPATDAVSVSTYDAPLITNAI